MPKELNFPDKESEVSNLPEGFTQHARTLTCPISMYGAKVGQANRTIIDSFEMWCWRRALWIPWTTRKMNKWVPKQIKPTVSLEAKMTKLKSSYSGYILRRQASLGKENNAGKIEGSKKRERPNLRWIDSIKDAIRGPMDL